jgi:curved DNA-binding protein CbpA
MTGAGQVDPYAELGVSRDASRGEIRHAYRQLARRYHPDVNRDPRGPERFATAARAYAILSDPGQRADHDQTRRASPMVSRSPELRHRQAPPRGIVELSPAELRHLADRPLTLTDGHGQVIVLPAGAGPGDRITLLYRHRPVILTIRRQRRT